MRSWWIIIAIGCGGGGESPPIEAGLPDAPFIADAPDIRHDAPPGADHGFETPTQSLRANVEQSQDNWVEVGPADLACLGTPSTDSPTTVAVALSTTVRDFQSDNLVPNATVLAFPNAQVGSPFPGSPDTADGAGKVTIDIPVGTKRFGIEMSTPNALDTIELNHRVAPNQATQTLAAIRSVSTSTAQTLPALIGISRTPGTGIVLGTFRDCQGREVSNFIATVSSTSGTPAHLPGADTFYFSSSVGLPVRHSQRQASSEDGLFMVIELAPASGGFVQVWGFPTDNDLATDNLVLVAELPIPVLPDTVIGGGLEPRRQ